jgi:ppGpp synthetase/RelA/SpoT-type nucleotidyltranferase
MDEPVVAQRKRALTYSDAHRLAKVAEVQVAQAIVMARTALGSPELVRAHMDEPRVKSKESLDRKAKQRRWSAEQALVECEDFLGLRMVCNNLQDVQRAADLIEHSLGEMGSKVIRKDFIAKPVTGYRAIHLLTRIPITVGSLSLAVGCEVQIRTLLQDAWAKLSRADLYRSRTSKELLKQFEAMSDTLADADKIAEDVRREISRPVTGKSPAVDASISESSLAFIYQRAFKEEPPVYLVDWMLQKIADAKVRVDALDAILQDRQFAEECQAEYQLAAKWAADPSRQLEWAIDYLLRGRDSALTLARTHGQKDWDEIDAQYRSEVRSTVPGTWDQFQEEMNDGGIDFLDLAQYFGTARECICGEDMIEFDDFIEAVFDHYGLRGDERHQGYDDLLQALNASGVEDADGADLCSYHLHQLNKDD